MQWFSSLQIATDEKEHALVEDHRLGIRFDEGNLILAKEDHARFGSKNEVQEDLGEVLKGVLLPIQVTTYGVKEPIFRMSSEKGGKEGRVLSHQQTVRVLLDDLKDVLH